MPTIDWNKRWGQQITEHVAAGRAEAWGCQWGDPRALAPLAAVFERYITPFVGPDTSVLEIGPGGGRWTEFLLGAKQLTLVDLNAEFFPYLRDRFREHAHKLTFYQTRHVELDGVATGSIDFAFSFGVFVHIDPSDIEGYLGHLKRVLAPGGRAVLQYADKTKPAALANDSFSHMTREAMQALAVDQGFLIEEHNTSLISHSNVIVLRPAAGAPPAAPVERRPAAPPRPTGVNALVEDIIDRVGFNPDRPSWTPALKELHRYSRSRHLQVIPEFFYTPVLTPSDVPEEAWAGTFDPCATFDVSAQQAFLAETPSRTEELADCAFDGTPGTARYFWNNDQFSHADAPLYYAILRRYRPARVVEVGAGHSTKLAARAVRLNGTGAITCIDPYAPSWLNKLESRVMVVRTEVQKAPDELFLDLSPGDVLFIDGSHISKTGSDVNHLFLRILPQLPAGVIVHIHDICLPYEYPRSWSEDVLVYWNEQYVLAALLANSQKYEVLAGVYFLQQNLPAALRPYVPALSGIFPAGGSIWLVARE